MSDLPIHYQDEHLLVVEKPAGLLSVPGKGPDKQDCLIKRLLLNWPTALAVHRLDMATSGLMVVPLTKKAHRLFGEMFASRQVEKRYIAVVDGLLTPDAGEVDKPLICDWPNRPKQMVDYDSGKPSLTRFKVLLRDNNANITRVSLEPVTGRSHQLRVHMLSLGHAILGDNLYMPEEQASQYARLHLHAETLAFQHPISEKKIKIISQVPF